MATRCNHEFHSIPNSIANRVKQFKQHPERLTNPQELKRMREQAESYTGLDPDEVVTRVWDFDANEQKVLLNVNGGDEPYWIPYNKPVAKRIKRDHPEFVIQKLGPLCFHKGKLTVSVCWSNFPTPETNCVSCLLSNLGIQN